MKSKERMIAAIAAAVAAYMEEEERALRPERALAKASNVLKPVG